MKTKNKRVKTASVASVPGGEAGAVVLVGTYKGDQLTKWPGWYNWPVGNGERERFSRKERKGRTGWPHAEAQRRGGKDGMVGRVIPNAPKPHATHYAFFFAELPVDCRASRRDDSGGVADPTWDILNERCNLSPRGV